MKIVYSKGLFSSFIIILLLQGCRLVNKKNIDQIDSDTGKSNIELLVGTNTNNESKGIYKLVLDTITGKLSGKTLLVESQNPGYLYISKNNSKVYSSNSTSPGSISVYEWNESRSILKLIGDYPSNGNGACYIELNPSERLLSAANFATGGIVVYPINENGDVAGKAQTINHTGRGPHPNQKSAHAHCVKFSESGKYLYAVDLGIDKILLYNINADDGLLSQQRTALKLDPGDGPRHLIFHPSNQMSFVVNELSSTVVSARVNHITGEFEPIDKQSTLPMNFIGKNSSADIQISPNGKFLYASNRGHNSIAVFSISENGKMKLLQNQSVLGDWPRNFVLSPDGKFLLVANQRSNSINVFRIDQTNGQLKYTGNKIYIDRPMCLKFY
tara:strand:+ start:201 stop:1358 length:1158 start_codon:yes stop_codon:yes gene_type:complete